MSVHQLVLLAGLLAAPIVLLLWAHGLRRRSARSQRAFWGAVAGHLVAIVAAVAAALARPAFWRPDDTLRGAAGFWALAALPALGARVAALRAAPDDGAPPRGR